MDDSAIDAGAAHRGSTVGLAGTAVPIRPRRVRSWWSPRAWVGTEAEVQRGWSRLHARVAAACACALMTPIAVDPGCWWPGASRKTGELGSAQFVNARDIELLVAHTGTRARRAEVEGALPAAGSLR